MQHAAGIIAQILHQYTNSSLVLPNTPRVRPSDQASDPRGIKDIVSEAATQIRLGLNDVVLARWTLDDLVDTEYEPALKQQMIEELGLERYESQMKTMYDRLATYSLIEPTTGVNLFDVKTRGPLFVKMFAKQSFSALTTKSIASIKTAFSKVPKVHHLVDNVAALTIRFPISDIQDASEFNALLTAITLEAIPLLLADIQKRRHLTPTQVSQLVCEYHLARVQDQVPALNSNEADDYEVPFARYYLRLMPHYAYRLGVDPLALRPLIKRYSPRSNDELEEEAMRMKKARLAMMAKLHKEANIEFPVPLRKEIEEAHINVEEAEVLEVDPSIKVD